MPHVELPGMAKNDVRLNALQRMFGVGPTRTAAILAEIGDAKRFPGLAR